MIPENIETLSSELNGRNSREIGGLIGYVNLQIQRAVEEAICDHVLPQVQNRAVQNRHASSPRDRERPSTETRLA